MRLLLVEDNNELSTLLLKSLRSAGFATDLVTRAEDAINALGSTTYAAAPILDLGLPDAEGHAKERRDRHHG